MTLIITLIVILVVLVAIAAFFVRRVNRSVPETPPVEIADDCCGAHAVCERDTLLSSTDQIIYFDDEELDVLRNRDPETFTEAEIRQIEEVFFSLREQDVSGWVRSINLRSITLPDDIREQALLIIAERRDNTLRTWQETHRQN